jgi:predicted DNA-binding WGR domain protein
VATREFHYSDEKSHKFWRITLDGHAHTVHYGRIGTVGQTQTKEFPSAEAAVAAYDKLIAEKLKKGYVEVTGDDQAPSPVPDQQVAPAAHRAPAGSGETPVGGDVAASPIAATAATEVAPQVVGSDDIARSIDLTPTDYLWATWRPWTPLPRPDPPPFDREQALARLSRIKTSNYGWNWDWTMARIPPSLTADEASFWFRAMTAWRASGHRAKAPAAIADELRQKGTAPVDDVEEIHKRLSACDQILPPEIMLPLAALLPFRRLVDLLLEDDRRLTPHPYFSPPPALIDGFRLYVLPYLGVEECEALRGRLATALPFQAWPADPYTVPPAAFFLAALVGPHDVLRALVESWPHDLYTKGDWHDHYHRPQHIVFGLGDPHLVEAQMRRLRLRLRTPAYVRAWLAHTAYAALDVIRDTILGVGNREEAATLLKTFAIVHATEVAEPMLELMLRSKAPQVARDWLDTHPVHSACGLISVAARRGALADAAVDTLRRLARRGHAEPVARALAAQPPDVADRLRDVIWSVDDRHAPFDDTTTPAWLRAALARVVATKGAKGAAWVHDADLPPISVADKRLSDDQVAALLVALCNSPLGAPHPLVSALREHADRAALDRFAWRLFELWLAEGAPSRENWAMQAIGHLGHDATVLKLTPLIRQWPGESQHQRAVMGLECLRAIGTDAALMAINGIAQKVTFKGLQARAHACMEQIAQDRGLTRVELEDRIVPDCDLDERGSRVFDFGARQFRFVLGPSMKPMVRNQTGALKPDLPKPGAKDDAAMDVQAVAAWKLLKKQVAEVAKVQAVRLEQAMITGRRWSVPEFDTLLVHHPLMTHLVRLLVWGVYDEEGRVVASFRVTEDQTYADSDDEAFDLPAAARVGVVHPLHLSDAERATWGELLSDYEIVPPFAQLGRTVYHLAPEERAASEIMRFKGLRVPAQTLVFTLEKRGWTRGTPMDAGVFDEHSKPFDSADVTAVVQYETGVPVGYMEGWEDQTLTRCYFVPGTSAPTGYRWDAPMAPLGTVDPVVVSEVLADLTAITAKGR